MKELEFKNLLEAFTYEILDHKVTDREKRFFWRYFQDISEKLKCDLSVAWEIEKMVHYDPSEMRRFRNRMANKELIELTPREAEIWLVMLEITLISVDFYEWEMT